MSLREKKLVVKEIGKNFSNMQAAFLVDYRGCSCEAITSLRRELREVGANIHVVKNTMARRAIKGTSFSSLSDKLVGPTAIVWAEKDPVSPAKAIKEFKKGHEKTFQIKAGVVEGKVVDEAQIEHLASLPSMEVLLSQLLSLINAPATKLLQTINAPGQNVVNLLSAWKDKMEEK